MFPSLLNSLVSLVLFVTTFVDAQSSTDSGYTGYNLALTGDHESVTYSSSSTPANVSTTVPAPDVYLNASVNVGEIDITVSNLTAKINLGAQVLQLLQFNAGVDVSIDRVSLLIQNVSAQVLLEVRLENLVSMINDTLNSLDLNPALATLGQDLGAVVNTTASALTGTTSQTNTLATRSYDLANNILYSTNDYSGNTHTNRILTQSGSIVDQSLDNSGNTGSQQVVGSYLQDMTFNGYNQSAVIDGQVTRELEYVYTPFNGLSVVSAIYTDAAGTVVATRVLSESSGGGTSTLHFPRIATWQTPARSLLQPHKNAIKSTKTRWVARQSWRDEVDNENEKDDAGVVMEQVQEKMKAPPMQGWQTRTDMVEGLAS